MKQRSFWFTNVSFIVYLLHGNLASPAPKIQFQKLWLRENKIVKTALEVFRSSSRTAQIRRGPDPSTVFLWEGSS